MTTTETEPEVDRRTYLGGPDMAALFGVDRYRNRMQVYLEKVGSLPGAKQNENMALGLEFEEPIARGYAAQLATDGENGDQPDAAALEAAGEAGDFEEPIARVFARRMGATIERLPFLRDPRMPFLGGHVDFLIGRSGRKKKLLEVKKHGWQIRGEFGQPGTNQIPARTNVQCQSYLRLLGEHGIEVDGAEVVVCFGGEQILAFDVPGVDDLQWDIEVEGSDFWLNHVSRRIPPEAADVGESALLWSVTAEPGKVLEAGSELVAMIAAYTTAKAQENAAKNGAAELRELILAKIGDATVVQMDGVVLLKVPLTEAKEKQQEAKTIHVKASRTFYPTKELKAIAAAMADDEQPLDTSGPID